MPKLDFVLSLGDIIDGRELQVCQPVELLYFFKSQVCDSARQYVQVETDEDFLCIWKILEPMVRSTAYKCLDRSSKLTSYTHAFPGIHNSFLPCSGQSLSAYTKGQIDPCLEDASKLLQQTASS